jgi:hypothetical protein
MFVFLLEGFTIFTTFELYSKLKVMAARPAEMLILDHYKSEAQLDRLIVLSQKDGVYCGAKCHANAMTSRMPRRFGAGALSTSVDCFPIHAHRQHDDASAQP